MLYSVQSLGIAALTCTICSTVWPPCLHATPLPPVAGVHICLVCYIMLMQADHPCVSCAVPQVTISRHPTCTCPDFAKGNLCKHILFVMLRVLKLPSNDPLVWQKALMSAEVEEVLSGARAQVGFPPTLSQPTAGVIDVIC